MSINARAGCRRLKRCGVVVAGRVMKWANVSRGLYLPRSSMPSGGDLETPRCKSAPRLAYGFRRYRISVRTKSSWHPLGEACG